MAAGSTGVNDNSLCKLPLRYQCLVCLPLLLEPVCTNVSQNANLTKEPKSNRGAGQGHNCHRSTERMDLLLCTSSGLENTAPYWKRLLVFNS